MYNNEINIDEVKKIIINTIQIKSPNTVEELINIIEYENKIKKEKLVDVILQLQREDIITFNKVYENEVKTIIDYLLSKKSFWFWVNIIITTITYFFVNFIPTDNISTKFLRYIFGSISILFLPGYNLIKILYPTKEINNIERTALSIGCSIAIVPLIGLLLNYAYIEIKTSSIMLIITTLTLILSITAIFREYNSNK